jgi:diaminohydroxyphosphoribosylaminopyrimidine deaminase/5-amino-6-(5-phosphoribosylamino)uracil reductase
VVGVNTVLRDDPELTCRGARVLRVATRIVLDPHLRTPPECRLVRSAARIPTLIVSRLSRSDAARRARKYPRVELLSLAYHHPRLDLKRLLEILGGRGMSNVLVEGGGRTAGAFYDAGLVDEACIFVSPRLIGGHDAPAALDGVGPALISEAPRVRRIDTRSFGDDLLYHLRLTDPADWL